MKRNSYIFEMICPNCNRKFVSKIKQPVPCPYCGKMSDKVNRIVKVEDDPLFGKVYIDVSTGKFLKIKTR